MKLQIEQKKQSETSTKQQNKAINEFKKIEQKAKI